MRSFALFLALVVVVVCCEWRVTTGTPFTSAVSTERTVAPEPPTTTSVDQPQSTTEPPSRDSSNQGPSVDDSVVPPWSPLRPGSSSSSRFFYHVPISPATGRLGSEYWRLRAQSLHREREEEEEESAVAPRVVSRSRERVVAERPTPLAGDTVGAVNDEQTDDGETLEDDMRLRDQLPGALQPSPFEVLLPLTASRAEEQPQPEQTPNINGDPGTLAALDEGTAGLVPMEEVSEEQQQQQQPAASSTVDFQLENNNGEQQQRPEAGVSMPMTAEGGGEEGEESVPSRWGSELMDDPSQPLMMMMMMQRHGDDYDDGSKWFDEPRAFDPSYDQDIPTDNMVESDRELMRGNFDRPLP